MSAQRISIVLALVLLSAFAMLAGLASLNFAAPGVFALIAIPASLILGLVAGMTWGRRATVFALCLLCLCGIFVISSMAVQRAVIARAESVYQRDGCKSEFHVLWYNFASRPCGGRAGDTVVCGFDSPRSWYRVRIYLINGKVSASLVD